MPSSSCATRPCRRSTSWSTWACPSRARRTGKIAQRPFGGHTNNVTGKPVRRACYAADRTGHMILQTLYQQCIKNNVNFFDEFQVLDLLIENGAAAGVVAVELATGELHVFHAKAVIFATGGHGRIWEITSNAYSFTGDGPAIAMRRGLPLEDMEFFQFHPTGIYKLGILITEGVRGEGGVLINDKGERFMEKYAPKVKDLASRDVVSRAMYLEMREGRGIGGKRYLYLDMRPETVNKYAALDGRKRPDGTPYAVTGEELLAKLPDIVDFCRTYLGVDPVTQLDAGPAHRALRHGRHPHQQVRRGGDRREEHRHARAVRGRRVRLRLGARRQPPGHQLAARPDRLRQARRAAGGRVSPRAPPSRPLPADPTDFARQQFDRIRNGRRQGKRLRHRATR